MVNTRWVSLLVACALVVAAACGKDTAKPTASSTSGPGASPAVERVQRGGTLAVALEANPRDFDPMLAADQASTAVTANIFESLYALNEKLLPVPWLVQSVDQPDPATYVFTLRDGVRFHDGSLMDAEAVKFSIDRVRQNPRSPGFADGQDIAETTVVDGAHLRLVLKAPSASLPARLAGRLGAVVSPAAVRTQGAEGFNRAPSGTGPFRFGEFKADDYLRLDRFDGYWRMGNDNAPLPYLDRVEWRIMAEPSVRLTALQTGDVDIANVRDQDAKLVKADKTLVYAQQAGLSFNGIYLSIDKPPFDSKPLRQAVAYAIDRQEIIDAVYEGNREIAHGPIPPVVAWAVDPAAKPYPYDPAKAKQKLVEGGRPDGFAFTFWAASGNSTIKSLAELLQAQLARVGIRMQIELADPNGVVIPKLRGRESNAYNLGLVAGPDPDTGMSNLFRTGGSFNFFPYDNATVTDLLTRAVGSMDQASRGALYRQAAAQVMEDSPYIFLTYGIDRFAGSTKVRNWALGLRASAGYSEYWKAK